MKGNGAVVGRVMTHLMTSDQIDLEVMRMMRYVAIDVDDSARVDAVGNVTPVGNGRVVHDMHSSLGMARIDFQLKNALLVKRIDALYENRVIRILKSYHSTTNNQLF